MESYLLSFIAVLLSCLSFFLVRVFLKVERNSELFIRMDANLSTFVGDLVELKKDIIELQELRAEVTILKDRVENLRSAMARKKNGVGSCPNA